MFAAAETDLEPARRGRRIEQLRQRCWRRCVRVERKVRQQMFDQVGLMRAKLVTLAPSEERTLTLPLYAVIGRRLVPV